jgi:cytidylate kinase
MIILLNGTAGSGKGTLSRMLARYLMLPHYDFGLLFRAISFARRDDRSWRDIENLIASREMYMNRSRLLWNGTDVTEHLMSEEAGLLTAQLAKVSPKELVELSKLAVKEPNFVADGRTVSEIYPHADWHFQIAADYNVAAQRRLKQGGDIAAFKRRWDLDADRVVRSSRAVVIDTTNHAPKNCVRNILSAMRESARDLPRISPMTIGSCAMRK